MKKIKGIDRSDLAKDSWKRLQGFFRRYPNILKVIDYVKKNDLEDKLHASTSLQRLTISPRHRYDAKVHVLIISEEGATSELVRFDTNGKLIKKDHFTSEQLVENVIRELCFLIEEYELRQGDV